MSTTQRYYKCIYLCLSYPNSKELFSNFLSNGHLWVNYFCHNYESKTIQKTFSVTRLDYFLKKSGTNFHTKLTQLFGDFSIEKCCGYFKGILGENWTIFYSNIWSHGRLCLILPPSICFRRVIICWSLNTSPATADRLKQCKRSFWHLLTPIIWFWFLATHLGIYYATKRFLLFANWTDIWITK